MSVGYIYGNREAHPGFNHGMYTRAALAEVVEYGDVPFVDFPYNEEVPEILDKWKAAYEGIKDKLEGFEQVLAEWKLAPHECLYMGDDVIDMPPMRRAGVAVAVADAVPELDEVAYWRTRLGGGHGAVCEAIRELLIAQGKLDGLLVYDFDPKFGGLAEFFRTGFFSGKEPGCLG